MATPGSTTTSSEDALASADSAPQTFSLPFPVGGNDPAVHFEIKPRNKKKKKQAPGQGAGGIIALPVPAGMTTGYGMSYDTGTGIGALGAETMRQVRNNGGDVQSVLNNIDTSSGTDAIVDAAKAAITKGLSTDAALAVGALLGGAPGAAVGYALQGAAAGALAGAGIAINPHLAVLFTGPRFRTHQFNYKLSPRSAGESGILQAIIYQLKLAMAPSIDGGAFFDYPDEFDISFPQNEDFMFKIGTSVLTDFSINYAPDGQSAFHSNGAPVSVQMSMSFTEIDVITKDKIAEGR